MDGILYFIVMPLLTALFYLLPVYSEELFGKSTTYKTCGLRRNIIRITSHDMNTHKIKLNRKAIKEKYEEVKQLVGNGVITDKEVLEFKQLLERAKSEVSSTLRCTFGYFPKKKLEGEIEYLEEYIMKTDALIK